jgi:hypothetical protein
MTPEIEALLELLARSVYERWKAGELVPGEPVPPSTQLQKDELPNAPFEVYDRQSPVSARELLGCASTPTPGTAWSGKQKRR